MSLAIDLILITIKIILIFGLYMLPGIIAIGRQKRNAASILIINLCLGWTVIGWIVALAWACAYEKPVSMSYPEPENPGKRPLGACPVNKRKKL